MSPADGNETSSILHAAKRASAGDRIAMLLGIGGEREHIARCETLVYVALADRERSRRRAEQRALRGAAMLLGREEL